MASADQHDLDSFQALARRLLLSGLDRLRAFLDTFPEALRDCQIEVDDHIESRIGSFEDHFLGPIGTPAFALLAATAEVLHLDDPEDPRLIAASEGMLCAYYAVRIQDERIDDDVNPTWSFLEHVYLARLPTLLVAAAGGELAYLDRWLDQVRAFSEAAMVDDGLRASPLAPWDLEQIRLQGRKFLPMLGPLAALCWGAGHPELEPALAEVVEAVGTGLQLANDMDNAASDLEAGRGSPWLQRLGLMPGRDRAAQVPPATLAVFSSHEFHFYQTEMLLHLRRAGKLCDALGSRALSRHVADAESALRERGLALTIRALRATAEEPCSR